MLNKNNPSEGRLNSSSFVIFFASLHFFIWLQAESLSHVPLAFFAEDSKLIEKIRMNT